MGVPELEKPPGIETPWFGIWRASLKQMKEQGTWTLAQRPLLDEYVLALRAADFARERHQAVEWDKASKRALALAEALQLTAKKSPAKAKGAKYGRKQDADPFAALDELAPRRKARANGA